MVVRQNFLSSQATMGLTDQFTEFISMAARLKARATAQRCAPFILNASTWHNHLETQAVHE